MLPSRAERAHQPENSPQERRQAWGALGANSRGGARGPSDRPSVLSQPGHVQATHTLPRSLAHTHTHTWVRILAILPPLPTLALSALTTRSLFGPEKWGPGFHLPEHLYSLAEWERCLPPAPGTPTPKVHPPHHSLHWLLGFSPWLQPNPSAAVSGFEAGDSPDRHRGD